MILPVANLKAKDLPRDFLPHREILKAYEEAGHEYKFDSDASVHDRVWQHHFWPQINGNVRTKNQEIEQRISNLMRVKDSKGQWLVYGVGLFGLNHKGEKVDFYHTEGKIEGIPVFEKKVNPDTEEVEFGPQIHDHKTLYTIPFTKAKVDELSKYFADSVGFAVEGPGLGSRTYSCSLEDLRDLTWDELVQKTTAYLHTDYYKMKQMVAASRGGVK